MVTEAENSGPQHHRDFNVKPTFDNLPRCAEELHHSERHDAADEDLPSRFDPEMNQPPPPIEIDRHIVDLGERDEIEKHERHHVHAHHRHHAGDPARRKRSADDVPGKDEHNQGDADRGPTGRLDVFATLLNEPQRGVSSRTPLDEDEDHRDHQHGGDENPEQNLRGPHSGGFAAEFFGQEPIYGTHETHEQPDDHR